MPPILVETGPLYAMAYRDDDWHHRTVRFLQLSRDEVIIPVTILPEAAYLLAAHLGAKAEQRLVQSIVDGEMEVEELTIPDLLRSLELMRRYEDAQIGFVDATVVAVAERLKLQRILSREGSSLSSPYIFPTARGPAENDSFRFLRNSRCSSGLLDSL